MNCLSEFDQAIAANVTSGLVSTEVCLEQCARIAKEMLEYRGFQDIEGTTSPESISANFESMKPILFGRNCGRPNKKDCQIIFLKEVKIGVKIIRELIEKTEENVHTIIVSVLGGTSTRPLSRLVQFEILTYSQLAFNVMKHVLVPAHIFLNNEETDAVLKKYDSEKSSFPILSRSDPVSVFCNFVMGDMIEIHQYSFGGYSEAKTSYRVVD
tara:strand:+ start:767 stop:1402 length:636 start_codon:yes stop_codon:yes gene_type:complete